MSQTHGAGAGMAASATLHCLTGCAIGEIAGMVVGAALGLSTLVVIVLSVALAFVFGFSLSSLPLLRAGLGVGAALSVVALADTLSIATMEVVDNVVMALIPGAMDAGLVNVVFWVGMPISLVAAFAVAFPVNRWLLARGRGHALTQEYHERAERPEGLRRLIPNPPTSALVAALAAFLVGGLVVSVADHLEGEPASARSRSPAVGQEPALSSAGTSEISPLLRPARKERSSSLTLGSSR